MTQKKEKIKMEVTPEEQDLLEYAQDIFDRMTDMPKE